MTVYQLPLEPYFPDPRDADKSGVIAVGGDLSPQRLIEAYSSGIFPWFNEDDPIIWWSPDPRFVLVPQEFHCPKSLKRIINKDDFTVTADTSFEAIITGCAAERMVQGKHVDTTWITCDMQNAYIELHKLGFAHSIEVWKHGNLVGGLYGVSLGGMFFGESMFTTVPNASKIALVRLVSFLLSRGFDLIDSQVETGHLKVLGAKLIPREEYLSKLDKSLLKETLRGSWRGFF